MNSRIFVFPLIISLLLSCGEENFQRKSRVFPDVQIPSVYTEESEILYFLGKNWWSEFLKDEGIYICDSNHILGVASSELVSKMTQYYDILTEISIKDMDAAGTMISELFTKVEQYQKVDSLSNVMVEFRGMMDTYLYNPNSPVRNESLYHFWASKAAVSPLTPDSLRVKYANDASSSALNMTGTKAREVNGFYSVKTPYKILAFVNYGCHACKEMRETLGADEVLSWVKEGKLSIIDIPADPVPDSVYSIRAIPSLYLLAGDNKVIFKDVPDIRIVEYLRRVL